MCTTVKTKHHGCGHTQYQNTSHCHIVRRLQSSSYSSSDVGDTATNENFKGPYPSQGQQQGGQVRQPSRDDHRLLLQSTKWLPDSQPRVPPAMFQCVKNVATRPVDGLCNSCLQQTRNLTPGPQAATPPVLAVTPSQQASPQVQSRKEGRAKLHKKDKKSEPSSLLDPDTAAATSSTSLSPSAAATTPRVQQPGPKLQHSHCQPRSKREEPEPILDAGEHVSSR
ncbi:hypothetical protein PG988_004824 [Apiospora saccharicola]